MGIVEIILFVILLASAILSLEIKSLLAAVVTSGAYSFTIALLYIRMGAVDVAFTEAVVGAGLVGVFFITALAYTTQRSSD
jgi:multicomponent Na+:H+ antiporter subunit B